MYAVFDLYRLDVRIYEDLDGIGVLLDCGAAINPPAVRITSLEALKALRWGTKNPHTFDWANAREYLSYNFRHRVNVPVTTTN